MGTSSSSSTCSNQCPASDVAVTTWAPRRNNNIPNEALIKRPFTNGTPPVVTNDDFHRGEGSVDPAQDAPGASTHVTMTRRGIRPADRSSDFFPVTLDSSGLYNFQATAVNFLEHDPIFDSPPVTSTTKKVVAVDRCQRRRFLGLEPGLGKTVVIRRYASCRPPGYKILFLTHAGLVHQTANTLQTPLPRERRLLVSSANTGAKFQRALARRAEWDVLVVNMSVRCNYLTDANSFDLVVIDEAHRRWGVCERFCTRQNYELVMMSGNVPRWSQLPPNTKAFRVDKTPQIMRGAGITPVRVCVAPVRCQRRELLDYYDSVAGTVPSNASAGTELVLHLHVAMKACPQLEEVWHAESRLRFARTNLDALAHSLREGAGQQPVTAQTNKVKRALAQGSIRRAEEILRLYPELPSLRNYFGDPLYEMITGLRESGRILEPRPYGALTPRALSQAVALHSVALLEVASPSSDSLDNIRQILASSKCQRQCCPRILARSANVPATIASLEAGLRDQGVVLLPLETSMPARARERNVARFQRADGAQVKMAVLRRGLRHLAGACSRAFELWDGAFLDLLELFIVQPRILVCDAAGDLGFDLHLSVTAIVSNTFLPTYSACLQFTGRACRLAPDKSLNGALVLQMPMFSSTLEEIVLLPRIRSDACEAANEEEGSCV